MNTLRRHFGLRWQRTLPAAEDLGIDLQNLLIIAILMLAFGIVGSMDYADEQRQESERMAASAELNRAALLACLNGGSPGLYIEQPDGSRQYLVCSEPYEVSDKNTSKPAT